MTIKLPSDIGTQSARAYAEAVATLTYDHDWDLRSAEALAYVESAKVVLDWVWATHPEQLAEYVANSTVSKCSPVFFDIAQDNAGIFADDLWQALRPLLNDGLNPRPKAQGFGN